MLTTIPREQFKELTRALKEDESNSKKKLFSFRDFLKNVIHYSMVKEYLSDKNVKFVGKGSSRTAFFLPGYSCFGIPKYSPVCLKVADNIKGLAQNKAENDIISKNGKGEICFPKIFNYDNKGNIAMITEIGTPAVDNDFKEYFKELTKLDKNIPNLEDAGKMHDFLYDLAIAKRRNEKEQDKMVEKTIESMKQISKRDKKYEVLYSILHVLFQKNLWNEISLGDFQFADNWAIIIRNNEEALIPIDWGLSREVAYQYYC